MAEEFQIEFVERSEDFEALRFDWEDLCARATGHHYFQRFDWPWRAWKFVAMVRGRRLCILVGKWHGRVVFLWPLMRDDYQLRLIASDQLEYRDLIIEDSPHAQSWMLAAWTALKNLQGIDLLLLQDVRSEGKLAKLLEINRGNVWKRERRSRVIRLDRFRDWNDYVETLPKKLQRDQQRQWRRIASLGDEVRFEILNSDDEIQNGFDWVFRRKLLLLESKKIRSVNFESQEYRAFLNSVIQNSFKKGHLIFATLNVGDVIVSAGVGYKYEKEFTFHMFAYDNAWETYSPGRLLLENIVKWCFSNDISLFDFMPGEEIYKNIWANDEFLVADYIIPITTRGWFITKLHACNLSVLADNALLTGIYHCLPSAVRNRMSRVLLRHREYAGRLSKL